MIKAAAWNILQLLIINIDMPEIKIEFKKNWSHKRRLQEIAQESIQLWGKALISLKVVHYGKAIDYTGSTDPNLITANNFIITYE